jgi:hypothetical protein
MDEAQMVKDILAMYKKADEIAEYLYTKSEDRSMLYMAGVMNAATNVLELAKHYIESGLR